jgi:hypothetical protein
MKVIAKVAKAFGMFWWNFLVGDTPELFVSVVALLVVTAVFKTGHARVLMVALPLVILASLAASVFRAIRRR